MCKWWKAYIFESKNNNLQSTCTCTMMRLKSSEMPISLSHEYRTCTCINIVHISITPTVIAQAENKYCGPRIHWQRSPVCTVGVAAKEIHVVPIPYRYNNTFIFL